MSKNKDKKAIDRQYELAEATQKLAEAPAVYAAGSHPEHWLLGFDIDGLRIPEGRQSENCVEIVDYLAMRSKAWVGREEDAKQTAELAKHLLKLEEDAGRLARKMRDLTSEDLRMLLTLAENDQIEKHPALIELSEALGNDEFLPLEYSANYASETQSKPVARLQHLSRWLGLAAAALKSHHRGGSKKISKVLGADPSWFMVHDAYRTCIALGLEPSGSETGWFEQFVEHLRHGVYTQYKGSPRSFIRNYIDERAIYVRSAEKLRVLMREDLGLHHIKMAQSFNNIIHGKRLDPKVEELPGFEEIKKEFLSFRRRVDIGV